MSDANGIQPQSQARNTAAGVLVAFICLAIVAIFNSCSHSDETSPDAEATLKSQRADAATALTNAVYKAQTGVSRIVATSIDDKSPKPDRWTASADFDYVNRMGVIEHRTLFFTFKLSSEGIDCEEDVKKSDDLEHKVFGN